ncbi:MAG: alanine/ornithine racemase family PLP-dependent enzyme [Acholeplasmataceae bacterium]|nr:alanine/ornithine racemase family PLP-dependent enzyme [Acholeplasmataceae bacterium]
MYPKIHIHLKKYAHNVNFITTLLHKHNLSIMAVSKVFSADPRLIEVLNKEDIDYIADSRIDNLKKIVTNKPKVLLRIPKMSEVSEVIMHTDISLNSELEIIDLLNTAAHKLKKIHSIILMFDIGDLREGIYYKEDYLSTVKKILSMSNIKLLGIGTNLTCYGAVIPTEETYEKLEDIIKNIESNLSIKIDLISGGNSSSLLMLMNQTLPKYINNLRIGEALVLGRETAYGNLIEGLYDDVFTLEAEIIEIKVKPSMPEGITGMDAFGKKVRFFDQGMITRAILSIGRQDVDCANLIPPKGVNILGCSSDHLIVELKNLDLEIGDTITFKLNYGGILSLMTSPYVEKTYDKSL